MLFIKYNTSFNSLKVVTGSIQVSKCSETIPLNFTLNFSTDDEVFVINEIT